jgi:hypothetical protein
MFEPALKGKIAVGCVILIEDLMSGPAEVTELRKGLKTKDIKARTFFYKQRTVHTKGEMLHETATVPSMNRRNAMGTDSNLIKEERESFLKKTQTCEK